MEKANIVFDVDSTVISEESLEILAEILLQKTPFKKQKEVFFEIEKITNLGMEGKITLQESVEQRMALLPNVNEKDIQKSLEICEQRLTQGIKELIKKLQKQGHEIFVVSGGPDFLIKPLAKKLGIKKRKSSFFALDKNGKYEPKKSKIQNSKTEAIKELMPNKKRKIIMIGDGATDLATLDEIADFFIGYIEHAQREIIINNASFLAKNTHDLEKIIKQILI